MTEQYQGTCPICGVSLIIIPGNKLQCPDNHYICDRWAFENRWRIFQKCFSGGEFISNDKFLADLVVLNELDIDPALIAKLQEKAIGIPDDNNEP